MSETLKILSFESSCDDTSVAILEREICGKLIVRSLSLQSQNEVHEKWGGVVPELASRAHLKNLLPCLEKALSESHIDLKSIDVFAATSQPGLIGSLLVGHTAARTLALLFDKKFLSVNHLDGHVYSIFLEREMRFPFLSLVVSGGHTCLYIVRDFLNYEALGLSLDDAAGEALDKAAKLLGLGFPGGAQLEELARGADSNFYTFGRVQTPQLHFSFSGLKSEFARLVKREGDKVQRENAAASFQLAVFSHIENKLRKAIQSTGVKRLSLVGGVARNQLLRQRLQRLCEEGLLEDFSSPSPVFCTDNAAMIGLVAMYRHLEGAENEIEADVRASFRPSREKIRREKKA